MNISTQIAYIPMHASGNLHHPDVEFGFVTSICGDAAFCRYWRKGKPGVLRTVANSELTPLDMLVEHVSVAQVEVNRILKAITGNRRVTFPSVGG